LKRRAVFNITTFRLAAAEESPEPEVVEAAQVEPVDAEEPVEAEEEEEEEVEEPVPAEEEEEEKDTMVSRSAFLSMRLSLNGIIIKRHHSHARVRLLFNPGLRGPHCFMSDACRTSLIPGYVRNRYQVQYNCPASIETSF
jgi:hypothetical protein